MDAKRLLVVPAAAAALALSLAPAAGAAGGSTTLHGTTSEGVTVKLRVASFGNATAFKIGKTKVSCTEGGTLSNSGGTYKRFDASDPGEFHDRRSTKSERNAYEFKTRSAIRGAWQADHESWSGTFKLKTRVFKDGEKVDLCRLKTAWSAA